MADEILTEPDEPIMALTAAIKSLRERSRDLMRGQSARLRELENKLERQLTDALQRLEQEPREIAPEEQALFDRAETLERDVKHLQQLRRESEQALEEARLMLGELEEERRILRDRLEEAENRALSGAPPPPPADDLERLNRRLEMAMQEIRDLKYQNAELAQKSQQPAGSVAAAATSSSPPSSPVGRFDWESEKQRLLQQLSVNFDSSDATQAKEKLRYEDLVRSTDRAIAEKDREIDELRRQLEEQQSQGAPQPSSKVEVEGILASDQIVQAERERLAAIQSEWQEKLRQAEVEISIERAKIARERSQLEEKLRQVATQSHNNESSTTAACESKTPTRGRWLSRLGLNNDDNKTE